MKIVFSFVGGRLNDAVLSGDTEQLILGGDHAVDYYRNSNRGEVGYRFTVAHQGESETYEVARRLQSSACLFIRAHHVIADLFLEACSEHALDA